MSDLRPGGGSSDHSAPETDMVVSFNNPREVRRCVDSLLPIDGGRVFLVDHVGCGGLSARWGHLRSLRLVLPLRQVRSIRSGGNDPSGGPVRSETA